MKWRARFLILSSMLLMISSLTGVVRADFSVSSVVQGDLNSNGSYWGSTVSETHVSSTGAVFQSGSTVYGGNSPTFYTGLIMSESNDARNFEAGVNVMKVTVTITDSSGASVSSIQIGNQGMLASPQASGVDWSGILLDLYNYLSSLCGLAKIPCPSVSLQDGAPYTGACGQNNSCDSTDVWAQWNFCSTTCPPNRVPEEGMTFRYQPVFSHSDVYTVAVTTSATLHAGSSASAGFPVGPVTSSYSFQYVYENDANSGNDAGGTFSTALGVALGPYSGLLYGADTVDMYKFDGQQGTTYYFDVIPPTSSDINATIYDPNWNYVIGSNLGPGEENFGSFTAALTGSYYLKLVLRSGSGVYNFATSTIPVTHTDFTITANPSSWTNPPLCMGGVGGTTFTFQGFGGFSGNIYFSGSLATTGSTTPFYRPSGNPWVFPADGSSEPASVVANANIPPLTVQQYVLTVTATSGSLSHSIQLTVGVSGDCSAGGGGGSVPAGSKITMADGTTTTVQDLWIGARVIVYDVSTGYQTTATIAQILAIPTNSLLTLHTSAGLPFRADANPRMKLHVLVNGQITLKPITEIQPGDHIYNWDLRSWVNVTSVTTAFGGTHTMYDLVTDPLHSPSGGVLEYIANGYPDCPQACKQ